MTQDLLSKHGARLAAVTAVVGVAAYGALMFWPRHTELRNLREQIVQRQAIAAQAGPTSTQITKTTQELAEAKEYVQGWLGAAPFPEAVLRDINQIAQAAQTRNLRLERAPVESLAAVWRAPVSLSVEGTFAQLFQFVQGVEAISPSLCLSPIELKRAEQDGQILRMTATLTIFGPKPDFSDYASLAE
jgi:Tfp pilus assembly protein PilO